LEKLAGTIPKFRFGMALSFELTELLMLNSCVVVIDKAIANLKNVVATYSTDCLDAVQPHNTAQISIIGNINTHAAKHTIIPIKPASLAHVN
jgi:hypothetical protein